MYASNSHSYTHLILALGIVREPTVWVFITSQYPGIHDIGLPNHSRIPTRSAEWRARPQPWSPTRNPWLQLTTTQCYVSCTVKQESRLCNRTWQESRLWNRTLVERGRMLAGNDGKSVCGAAYVLPQLYGYRGLRVPRGA